MNWLQENAVLVLAILTIGYLGFALIRAVVTSCRDCGRPTVVEEFEREEKVRRRIRRTIADRKANPPTEPAAAARGPMPSTRGVPPIDPFGGRPGWWTRVRRWFGRRSGGRNV